MLLIKPCSLFKAAKRKIASGLYVDAAPACPSTLQHKTTAAILRNVNFHFPLNILRFGCDAGIYFRKKLTVLPYRVNP